MMRNPCEITKQLLMVAVCALATIACSGTDKPTHKAEPTQENGPVDAEGQWSLGFNYHTGEGVPSDKNEAVKWYRKAAEQGHPEAQLQLGLLYNIGRAVPKDENEAEKWLRKAAEQGHPAAQSRLGNLYAGRGKNPGFPAASFNNIESYAWHHISSQNGCPLGVGFRDAVAKRMTTEEIAKAEKYAQKLLADYTKTLTPEQIALVQKHWKKYLERYESLDV